jgi:hypothetical protein
VLSLVAVALSPALASADIREYATPLDPTVVNPVFVGPVSAPDGMWFVAQPGDIMRMSPSGVVTTVLSTDQLAQLGQLPPGQGTVTPQDLAVGTNGEVWLAATDTARGLMLVRFSGTTPTPNFISPTACKGDEAFLGLAGGPGGAMWFWTTFLSLYSVPTLCSVPAGGSSTPQEVAVNGLRGEGGLVYSGGAFWFWAEQPDGTKGIGRVTSTGTVSFYPVPFPEEFRAELVANLNAGVTFVEPVEDATATGSPAGPRISELNPLGHITQRAIPEDIVMTRYGCGGCGHSLVVDSSGNVWFTVEDSVQVNGWRGADVARLSPSGRFSFYHVNEAPRLRACARREGRFATGAELGGIALGSDDAIWVEAVSRACRLTEFVRIPASDPGWPSTLSAPTTLGYAHPSILLPRPEIHALSGVKSAAHTVDATVSAIDILKLTVGVGALLVGQPEVTILVLEPSALEIGAEYYTVLVTHAIEADPPSSQYKHVASVQRRMIPRVRAGHGVSAQLARAWNGLISHVAGIGAYLRAALTSVERAKGAAAAGACVWVNRQNGAVRRYAMTASQLLRSAGPAYAAVRRALGGSRASKMVVPAQAVAEAKAHVAAEGLPSGVAAALQAGGVPPSALPSITASVVALPPRSENVLALTKPPTGLAPLARALAHLAATASLKVRCRRR